MKQTGIVRRIEAGIVLIHVHRGTRLETHVAENVGQRIQLRDSVVEVMEEVSGRREEYHEGARNFFARIGRKK